jgi:Fur family zinc uptake transcriptional regulator
LRAGGNDPGDDGLAAARQLIVAEAVCAARGERLNAPGRRVLQALITSERPMKAYDLMHALAEGGRSAAPPTVYRALRLLIGTGLAHRIESLNAFIACRFPGETHLAGFHVCERCGRADEFRLDALPPPVAPLEQGRLVFEVLKPCASCDGSTRDDRVPS